MEKLPKLVRGSQMKTKGKPKFPPTTEEKSTITVMAAAGASQNKIAKAIGRSRHLIKNTLALPEVKQAVKIEKVQLAEEFQSAARRVLVSISDEDISKASLQQKAISSGILLDKSLLLSGDAFPVVNIAILMDVVDAIRSRPQGPPLQVHDAFELEP